jgi:hypothetical protein
MPLGGLVALALSVNVPLGYLRSRCRPFSWRWFVYVHLSIPLIAACRMLSGIGLWAIPLLMVSAVIGQLAGGRIRS